MTEFESTGRRRWLLLALAVFVVGSCAAPGAGPGADGAGDLDAVWTSLRRPRPAPLPGAPRVTVSEMLVLGESWSDLPGATPQVGLQELISLGLLRRRDVHFVERRRFGPAAELERRGARRPSGAPPVGTSPGAEVVLTGTWSPSGPDSAALDLRLADPSSGRVLASWRSAGPRDADLPSIARLAVGGLTRALDEMGRLPEWRDPLTESDVVVAPSVYRDAGVPRTATAAFLRGLDAEDRYDWEAARSGYQRALRAAGERFFEADEALARAARLRAGGTLGES